MTIMKLAGVLSACLLAAPVMAERAAEHGDVATPDASLLLVEQGSSNLWDAQPRQGKPPRYPDTLLHRRVESCAAVGMIIERDGTTSGHRILAMKIRPEARAKEAAMVALVEEWAIASARNYTFKPGVDNPDASPGFTALSFSASRGANVVQECAVPDLRQAVAALQASDTR